MAWSVLAKGEDAQSAVVVLAELAAGVFPKTLDWGTDAAAESDLGAVLATRNLAIDGIRTELTTTATVGSRQLKVQLLDAGDDVLAEFVAVDTTAASLAQITEWMHVGAAPSATPIGAVQYERMPPGSQHLAPGMKLRVTQDGAIVDVADTLLVFVRGRLFR